MCFDIIAQHRKYTKYFIANGCLLLYFLVCVFVDTINVAKFNRLLRNSTAHQCHQAVDRREKRIFILFYFFPPGFLLGSCSGDIVCIYHQIYIFIITYIYCTKTNKNERTDSSNACNTQRKVSKLSNQV